MRNTVDRCRKLVRRAALGAALLAALPAAAHGPSVRMTYDGIRPAQIAIRVGQTVHFQNTSSTPRTFTVVADDGSFMGPAMPRGDGWHHTFETAGRFAYHLREYPEHTGLVIVAPSE